MMRLLLVLILIAVPVWADDAPLRNVERGEEARAWSGVGMLDLGGGFCTGALVRPDVVVTAAHCFFEGDTGRRIPDSRIRFRAGWSRGAAEAVRGARRVIIDPEYVATGEVNGPRVAADIAVMILDQPIATGGVTPFGHGPSPYSGDSVAVVSYAHDRDRVPSIQEACGVLGRQDGVLVLTCDVDFGSSGAPIFLVGDGAPRLVSVISAKAEMEGQRIALSPVIDGRIERLLAGVGGSLPGAKTATTTGTRRSLAEQLGRTDSGSAFGGRKVVVPRTFGSQ